ncbi:MAG: hypothetical protein HYU36_16555 [Planctomycetes bacterium]|nr:hypothetical protein [Planctomycetota bacterium]
MLDTATIHTYDFRHPKENLRGSNRQRGSPEAEFVDRFARAYLKRFGQVHSRTTKRATLFVREVPVHGNGIADLLALSWDRRQTHGKKATDLAQLKPTVRAFEAKLSDWSGGLMQAHRYRYFAHVAILVVPKSKLKNVESHLDLFQTLRVGLWGFDRETETITSIYTPRPKSPGVRKYGDLALAAAGQAASL